MTIRLLDLTGDATSRGHQHGTALAPNIKANVETYKNRFMIGGASEARIAEETETWAKRLEEHDAEYYEEMQAIAEASDTPLRDIALLNARYEISYSLYSQEAAAANDMPVHEPDGCTAFGILPEYTANGHTLLGQNWDWLNGLLGNLCLLRHKSDEHPDHILLTQAGIVSGMIGFNEHGVGLCVNGLSSKADGQELHHRPFHIRVRDIMRSKTLFDALKVIFGTDRVCSTNWMVGQRGGEILDIESSPNVAHTLYPDDGLITHGNHFINRTNIETEYERIAPCSLYRTPRLDRLIRQNTQKWDVEFLKSVLKDRFGGPKAICRYPNPEDPEAARTVTVAGLVMDLDELSIEISDGPPDQNEFVKYTL